jgi:hypothetical protein
MSGQNNSLDFFFGKDNNKINERSLINCSIGNKQSISHVSLRRFMSNNKMRRIKTSASICIQFFI